LENFDRLHFHLSKEQFDLFGLTPVRGDTKYHMDFYGYDSSNWDEADKRINITRKIEPAGDLYRVTFDVELNDTRGGFVIYDRLPSNKRFVPMRQRHERCFWFSVNHMQRQLVQLNFRTCFCCNNSNRTLTYYAMELFEADMDDGVTYVINHRDNIWGTTRE